MVNIPKFPKAAPPSLHSELKKRVQDYFNSKNIKSTGNFALYSKAIILFTLTALLYIHLVFYTPVWWLALLECGLLGAVVSSIGFNVMHDGGHGSFSENPFMNRVAALSLNLLGGNAFMWNQKHNVIHHAYTNVDGIDDDIEIQPFMRLSPHQPKLKMHRFQHLYFWFLYSLLYVYWIFVSDYKKYFSKKIMDMPLKKMSTKDHVEFWAWKIIFYVLTIVVPIIYVGFMPWLIGFLTMTLVAGFILSIVFQLAHTVEHTHFPMPDDATGKMQDEWMVHQLKTTSNFATKSKFISWYVGGLNFQVEHHLFPKISHVHYPAISKIVKEVCAEFEVPYLEYKYMSAAVVSHVRFLKSMGVAAYEPVEATTVQAA